MRGTSVFSKPAFFSVLFLVVASFAVYGQSLGHQFLLSWDDNIYVAKNPDIMGFSWDHIHAAFTKFYVGNYAPMQMLSYMLDYTLWGLNPAGFIGSNLLIHTVNGLLFYWLVAKITSNGKVAFVSALVFLLHPVQVESVVWIAQRKNVLAMFFFLLSFISFIQYRTGNKRRYLLYACALLAFICALLAKSVTVVLPLVLLLYDFCLHDKESRPRWLVDKIPFFAAAAVIALVTLKSQAAGAGGGIVDYPDESAFDIFLTMLTVFARYAGMFLWPTRLSIYYYTPIKKEIDLASALSGILIAAICAGLFYLYKKDKKLFFWATLVPVGILPVSQIVPLSTLMNDRYLYFPLLGAAVLVGWVLVYCADKLFARKRLAALIICLILLPVAVLSWQRSQVWYDSISIWSDALDKDANYVTYAGMGNALYKAGRIGEAVEMYERSLQSEPTCEEALRTLGAIYLNQGDYQKALHYIRAFADNYPDNTFAQEMLETVYGEMNMQQQMRQAGVRRDKQ